MNPRILLFSVSAALAGFLFGFDTVVISGAEQTIQALWNLSAGLHGAAIASALYGTVIGSLLGGWPTDRFGRKATLVLIGLLYCIGAAGSALATGVAPFIAARLIGGLGIGISTVAVPMYIAEIAPPAYRGRLAGLFQFNIVFGIVTAYVSDALLSGLGANAWRWMLGVAAVPSVIYTALCLGLPESPRWLIAKRGALTTAAIVLRRIRPGASEAQLSDEVEVIREASSRSAGPAPATGAYAPGSLWRRQFRVPILLAVAIAFFNQMSGINAILYFAPRIFSLTGLAQQAAALQSIGIGVTNLAFTFAGLWLIDRLGRRTLLYIGSFGYVMSLGLTSAAFFTGHYAVVPWCIFAFIAAHAVGQGAVIWVYISEIFPDAHRAEGQALGSFTHWFFAALLTTFFPKLVTVCTPGGVFAFFTFMMLLQLAWVHRRMIETKGATLEQIQRRLGVAAAVS